MKKKIFALLLAVIVILTVFVGCDANGSTTITGTGNGAEPVETTTEDVLHVDSEDTEFEVVWSVEFRGATYEYLRNKATDVMYLRTSDNELFNAVYPEGFSEMTDPNTGGPLTYDNFVKYLENDGTEISESTTNSLS